MTVNNNTAIKNGKNINPEFAIALNKYILETNPDVIGNPAKPMMQTAYATAKP